MKASTLGLNVLLLLWAVAITESRRDARSRVHDENVEKCEHEGEAGRSETTPGFLPQHVTIGACCPQECCDTKSQGGDQLAKAVTKSVEQRGALEQQAQQEVSDLAQQEKLRRSMAQDDILRETKKEEAISSERKDDTAHELKERRLTDQHDEKAEQLKEQSRIDEMQEQVQKSEGNLLKIEREENKVKDATTSEEDKEHEVKDETAQDEALINEVKEAEEDATKAEEEAASQGNGEMFVRLRKNKKSRHTGKLLP